MRRIHECAGVFAAAVLFFAGASAAQPRIVLLGSGTAAGVKSDGTAVAGAFNAGSVLTIGTSVVGSATPGFSVAAASAGLSFLAGSDGSGPARWNTSLGTAQSLGAWPSSSSRDISADGRYIAGWGYPTGSGSFRAWVWDANAAGGAGQTVQLPTVANGQAKAVGLDGTVAGVDECCGSANRPVVWRRDSGTGQWVESYLPFDGDPQTHAPYTGGDIFAMNDAGNVIVGSSNVGNTAIQLTRWMWNSGTQTWSRLNIPTTVMQTPSWVTLGWELRTLGATAVSEDGGTIVGYAEYWQGSSWMRGGFIWSAATGQAVDFYDRMVSLNTPGINFFRPWDDGGPPSLGFPIAMTPDAQHMATYASPGTAFGPPTLISFAGGPCVQPSAVAINSLNNVSAGSNAYLNCVVTGSQPLTVQWRFNGNPISDGPSGTGSTYYGATGHNTIGIQLVITQTSPADNGSYDCVVTNNCGTSTRPPVTLLVNSGACCYAQGAGGSVQCTVEGSSHCTGSVAVGGLGGVYMGDSTTCTPGVCDAATGACCYGTGGPGAACVLDVSPHCTLAVSSGGNAGVFLGNGTTCAATAACAAVAGACCYSPGPTSDVACVVEIQSTCVATNASGGYFGTYLGHGTTCAPTACNAVAGACCYSPDSTSNVICTIQTQTHCTGTILQGHLAGVYVGTGSTCLPVNQQCGFVAGACCYSADDTSSAICTLQLQDRCTRAKNNSGLGGAYRGDGTTCTPTTCTTVTGACCYTTFDDPTNLICTIQPSGRCTARFNAGGLFGTYLGGGSTCGPTSCNATAGACCYTPFGSTCRVCSLQPLAIRCTDPVNGGLGGTFAGAGSVCTPLNCILNEGACCVTGLCTLACATVCADSGGDYQGDGTTCTPDPCNPSPTGACCRGTTCAAEIAGNCTGANASFAGAGTVCNTFTGNRTTPCCLADYNHVGGVTVQDIFDFLSAYFTQNSLADINGVGGVTVQDIFDFLSAYFGGCS